MEKARFKVKQSKEARQRWQRAAMLPRDDEARWQSNRLLWISVDPAPPGHPNEGMLATNIVDGGQLMLVRPDDVRRIGEYAMQVEPIKLEAWEATGEYLQ